MQYNPAKTAARKKLCRQLWWGNMSVHTHDRQNLGFLHCTQWTELEDQLCILLNSAEIQMPSPKGMWAVNRKAMLTSLTVAFLFPQTRCLGSDCWMDDEGNVNCCHRKGLYCILIWYLQTYNHATETSLGDEMFLKTFAKQINMKGKSCGKISLRNLCYYCQMN